MPDDDATQTTDYPRPPFDCCYGLASRSPQHLGLGARCRDFVDQFRRRGLRNRRAISWTLIAADRATSVQDRYAFLLDPRSAVGGSFQSFPLSNRSHIP